MNKTKYSRIYSLIAIIIISLSSFTNNNEWTKYQEIDGVTIYTKVVKCNTEYNPAKNDYYVFKYVNSNNFNIRISWKLDLWQNDVCRSCDLESPNEYELSLDIKAKSTVEYVCSDNSKAFKIFKSSKKDNLYPRVKYKFSGLTVEKL